MNFPSAEADQTLPEDSWRGGAVSSRKQSGGQAEREGWQVTWIKVRTYISKAKGHKQGPRPETQLMSRQIFWAGLAEKGVRSKLGGRRLFQEWDQSSQISGCMRGACWPSVWTLCTIPREYCYNNGPPENYRHLFVHASLQLDFAASATTRRNLFHLFFLFFLIFGFQDLIPQPGIEPVPLTRSTSSPNHWMEFPISPPLESRLTWWPASTNKTQQQWCSDIFVETSMWRGT